MKAREHNPEGESEAQKLTKDPVAWRRTVQSLTNKEKIQLLHSWPFWARPKQMAPMWRWFVWMILAGRGFGKTFTAGQYVRQQVERRKVQRIALVGPTVADVRDVMIEGESGLLSIFPPDKRPEYIPSKRLIKFHTGAQARTYTAEEPDQLRGPQHDLAWCDEPAAFRYLDPVWKLLIPGLRLGSDPRVILTTTPRPLPLFHKLLDNRKTAYTTGTTYENAVNLPDITIEQIEAIYKGTDLGEQEINGKLLGQSPGALWHQAWIDKARVTRIPCDVKKKILVIDPSSSDNPEACEVGMMVLYLGVDGNVYVVEDLSCHEMPSDWVTRAARARNKHGAHSIVYESNHGGGFIVNLFKLIAPTEMKYLRAVHASEDKASRAQPVSALTQGGHVRMVGKFPVLESQLTTWIPGKGKSPDRLDALVHGVTDLAVTPISTAKTRPDPFPYAA